MATRYSVVEQQNHDRTRNGDKHAVQVQAGNTFFAEETKQKSAHNDTYNSEPDVQPESLAPSVDDLASTGSATPTAPK